MPNIVIVRDIAIIALALESLIIGLLLIVLIWQIRSLARLLEHEVKPILDSVNETASTVKGTTVFLSDNVISPIIRVASLASGVNRAIKVLTRRRRKEGEA
ncbi:MAG: hypothetical protein ACE5MB_03580 [Anaerolineae bacterium]